MSYKQQSLIQSIIILICGISVLDFGLLWASGSLDDALGINEMIFEDSDSKWWTEIVFWGYCFIAVGILQLMKALAADD